MSNDAVFCPKCGNPIAASSIPPLQRRQTREKGEKSEKREKGEKGEKNEKSRDWTGSIVGGLILIWLGVTFYLSQTGYIGSGKWWAYFLIGLGIIFLVQSILRYIALRHRSQALGSLVAGLILTAIGFSAVIGIGGWWLLFIALGAVIIVIGIVAASRTPRP